VYEALRYAGCTRAWFFDEECAAARRAPEQVLVYAVLVYEAFSYLCMQPSATIVCGLKLLVCEALSY
jgi:hypothetical protein